MLADAEDKGVIGCEAGTLWLHNVQVLTLGVRCRVTSKEVVRRILAFMSQGKSKGKSMGIFVDGMLLWLAMAIPLSQGRGRTYHQASFSSIYLQYT